MRYERPVIEERFAVKALLGGVIISGSIQPVWRPARSEHDPDDSADRG
jgi:hypothetical protein